MAKINDLVPAAVKNFIDVIFHAPIAFLDMITDMLGSVSLIAGRGINLNHYFSFFAYLPQSWQMVLQSLLASAAFLGVLFLIKAAWNFYSNVKGSIKWW